MGVNKDQEAATAYASDPFLSKDIEGTFRRSEDVAGLGFEKLAVGKEITIDTAVTAVLGELTRRYDIDKDGAFAGKELRTMFSALVDEVVKVEPGVEQYRTQLLAVSDRMGSMSATQVAALLKDGMNAADTNHDGIISAPEFRAVRQEIANPVKTR